MLGLERGKRKERRKKKRKEEKKERYKKERGKKEERKREQVLPYLAVCLFTRQVLSVAKKKEEMLDMCSKKQQARATKKDKEKENN